ncbi:10662_t:CDS:1 [Dentiscutata heterogama]|uniref:10662_t:CDS:1 n=1 Tax=Dentiscutata heterogama TaxID=1316150 RepID=A0ACA9MFE1_9GLOM|nr:10662_t:CDS:1 [Dentiscutata heterogama]
MFSQERIYVSKACTNCKRQHIKCSLHFPCTNCVKRKFECVFTNSSKRRGRKPKHKRVDVISSIQIQENRFNPSIDNQNQQLCKMVNSSQNHTLLTYDASAQNILPNDFNQEQFYQFNDITQKIDFLPQVHEVSNCQNTISTNYAASYIDNTPSLSYDYVSVPLSFDDRLIYSSVTESYNSDYDYYNQHIYNLSPENYYDIYYYDIVDSLTFN